MYYTATMEHGEEYAEKSGILPMPRSCVENSISTQKVCFQMYVPFRVNIGKKMLGAVYCCLRCGLPCKDVCVYMN